MQRSKLAMSIFFTAVSFLTSVSFLAAGEPSNWPRFRGPAASGNASNAAIPLEWSREINVLWRTEIAGQAWSSPVVWGERIFITSAEPPESQSAPRKGLYTQGVQGSALESEIVRSVICLEAASGRILWKREVDRRKKNGETHLKNGYASETPAVDAKRVVVAFGGVGLFAFDHAGEPLWKKEIPSRPMRLGWGTASSPILEDARVYYVNDNEASSYVACYDAASGAELWNTPRKEGSNWVTPFLWRNAQRTELITAGSKQVLSYDLSGKPLWEINEMSGVAIPAPFAAEKLLFVTSGHVLDQSRPLYAIRPGATGNVSLSGDATSNASIVWSASLAGPYQPTPLAVNDDLFVLYDRGLYAVFDLQTGTEKIAKRRLAGGRAFTASPILVGKHVLCLDEDGTAFVLDPAKNYAVVSENRLDDMTLATPAVADDRLFIRTHGAIYCIGSAR